MPNENTQLNAPQGDANEYYAFHVFDAFWLMDFMDFMDFTEPSSGIFRKWDLAERFLQRRVSMMGNMRILITKNYSSCIKF